MNIQVKALLVGALLVPAAVEAGDPARSHLYNGRGQITGSTVTSANGRIVHLYDERNRALGRIERTSEGWKTYDAQGRLVASAKAP